MTPQPPPTPAPLSEIIAKLEPTVRSLRQLSDSGDVSDWIEADVELLEAVLAALRGDPAAPGAARPERHGYGCPDDGEPMTGPCDHCCEHGRVARVAGPCPKCAALPASAPAVPERVEAPGRCGRCAGPHQFDTSIPSHLWNRVIRAAGLPDYICTMCIVRAFVKAGEGFTAELYGDGFSGEAIEVIVGGQPLEVVRELRDENNRLRSALRAIEPTHPLLSELCRPPAAPPAESPAPMPEMPEIKDEDVVYHESGWVCSGAWAKKQHMADRVMAIERDGVTLWRRP